MRIDRRFNGPADSANGGITCGMLAAHLDTPVVQVTLRKPPPLDTDLRVEDGRLYDGDVLVAEAEPGTIDVTPPPPVGVAAASAAEASYGGLVNHPFPTCFVCGTERTDGLGLKAGPVGDGLVATVWTPAESSRVMVWAALDCPGGWSTDIAGCWDGWPAGSTRCPRQASRTWSRAGCAAGRAARFSPARRSTTRAGRCWPSRRRPGSPCPELPGAARWISGPLSPTPAASGSGAVEALAEQLGQLGQERHPRVGAVAQV
jgi:hypothetical protein